MPLVRAHAALIAPSLPVYEGRAVVLTCYACRRLRHLFSSASRSSYNTFHLREFCAPEIRVAERLASINQGAANRVSEVIFCARTMIDGILSTSRCSTLKRHKLSAQSIVVEQCSSP